MKGSFFRPSPVLKEGQIVSYAGRRWVVGLVNSCRARLDPLSGITKTINVGTRDEKTFNSYGSLVSIAPTSILEEVSISDLSDSELKRVSKEWEVEN